MTPAASSAPDPAAETVVVDASAVVEALIGSSLGIAVRARMRGCDLHAPAHLDAEVLSALGRLHRGGDVATSTVTNALSRLISAPIARHPLAGFLVEAWEARERLRLADALYVQLSRSLTAALLTTDARLAHECESAELISRPA